MPLWKRILGRVLPMVRRQHAFIDRVSGRSVYVWTERVTGRRVLSEHALFGIRVVPDV